MKKKNILKIFSSILGVFSIVGLFVCSIFINDQHKKATSVSADSNTQYILSSYENSDVRVSYRPTYHGGTFRYEFHFKVQTYLIRDYSDNKYSVNTTFTLLDTSFLSYTHSVNSETVVTHLPLYLPTSTNQFLVTYQNIENDITADTTKPITITLTDTINDSVGFDSSTLNTKFIMVFWLNFWGTNSTSVRGDSPLLNFDYLLDNLSLPSWMPDDITTASNILDTVVDTSFIILDDYGDIDSFYSQGYQNGYNVGVQEGYQNGYNDGVLSQQQAINNAYSTGYTDGYNDGTNTDSTVVSIFSGILQVGLVPINFFLSIFNFEILGINLSAFIRALFTVLITIIVVKFVVGNGGGKGD